jgi:hypothetical protein
MKPGTLVKLGRERSIYDAVLFDPSRTHGGGEWYYIMPNMIGMFIRHGERHLRHGRNTPAIFLFEEKLVSAYLEVFEPLEDNG